MEKTHDFPCKLGLCIRLVLESEKFDHLVEDTIESSPPEWINMRTEPARHYIKITPKEIMGTKESIT